jgi:thioester reductase-like protein
MKTIIMILMALLIFSCDSSPLEQEEVWQEPDTTKSLCRVSQDDMEAIVKIRNVMTALIRFKQSHYEQYGSDFGLDEFINWSVEELAEASRILGYDQTSCLSCHRDG